MSQHLLRKEIKRNELAEAVEKTVHYAESHRRLLIQALVGVLALGLVIVLVALFRNLQKDKAAEALAAAIRVYDAPIDATAPKPDDAVAPSFADEAARTAKATSVLEKVRSDYRGAESGLVAASYLARIAADKGDLPTARRYWQEVADGTNDGFLGAQARLSLLKVDLAEGKKEEAAKSLEGWLERTEKPMPEDMILFELASVREELGKTDEALSAYQRIVDEFPRSPYGSEAQQRVSILSAGKNVT